MPVCVDASIVVAVVTTEVFSQPALVRWNEWVRGEQQPVAPRLLAYEISSALRRKVLRGVLSPEDARRALVLALGLNIHFPEPAYLPLDAFDLVSRLGCPTVYDACYVALAAQLECEFWTADERLYNIVREKLSFVRWLGNQQ